MTHLKLVSLMAPLYKLKYHRKKDRGNPKPQIREANSQSDNFLCVSQNLQRQGSSVEVRCHLTK